MNVDNLPDDAKRYLVSRADAARAAVNAEQHLLDAIHRWFNDAAGDYAETVIELETADEEAAPAKREQMEAQYREVQLRREYLQEQRHRFHQANLNAIYANRLRAAVDDVPTIEEGYKDIGESGA